LYRIGTWQSDVSSLRVRPLFRLTENENRTVELSPRQFTIGNARIAVNGLLHEIHPNQLVSILKKRIPPRGEPDSHPRGFGRLRKNDAK
jgi:hypothetical protein